MSSVSLWEATGNRFRERPALTGNHYGDVVIIGGGFTGVSTAYYLARYGANPIVLEQNTVGSGASGRNGGQVLTGFLPSMSVLSKNRGLDTAKRMMRISLDAIELIEQLAKANNIDCSFERNGHLYAAYKPSHLDDLKKEQEVLAREFDYNVEILEKQDLIKELSTDFYSGGMIDSNSALFHPFNYVTGLAAAAEREGAVIFEHSRALKIERLSKNKVGIHTDGGKVTANDLVIATDAYSEDLHKKIRQALIPVESIMIATEVLSKDLVEFLIKKNRAVFDTKHMLYYFRRTPDDRIAFGGSGRSTSKRDAENLYKKLYEGMLKVFPELQDAKIEYEWNGKVGFTRDMLPCMGRLKEGTYFALGYAGHGAAMSTYMGRCLADSVMNQQEEGNPFIKEDLEKIPFHSQHEKVVNFMKYYYKVLDYIS